MLKKNNGPIRIKDIARHAGVSTGTVDRVIHNRGKVSELKKQKIQDAIETLGYKPNMMARSLARKTDFEILVLLPNTNKDSFWQSQLNGINKAYDNIKDFGFHMTFMEFNDQKDGDLLKYKTTLSKKKVDALLLAPTTNTDSHILLDHCKDLNIPYVLVNTNLNRKDEQYLGYVGQDSFQSGILAAQLLVMTTETESTIGLFHMEKALEHSTHMMQKEKGFTSFFETKTSNHRNFKVASIPALQQKSNLKRTIKKFLEINPETKGIFVTTSRVHYLVEILNSINRDDISLVGFDLITENISAFSEYNRLLLINQNPEKQAYAGLNLIFEYLLENKKFSSERYLPLDIVTSENVNSYMSINTTRNPLPIA